MNSLEPTLNFRDYQSGLDHYSEEFLTKRIQSYQRENAILVGTA